MVDCVEVFVSYSWVTERDTGIVDQIAKLCDARNIRLRRDLYELEHGEPIDDFMKELTNGKHILLVFSEAYFASKWCMYELLKIWQKREEKDFLQQTNIIVVDGCNLQDQDYRLKIKADWESVHKKTKNKLDPFEREDVIAETEFSELYRDISQKNNKIIVFLSKLKIKTLAELQSEHYASILDPINAVIKPEPEPEPEPELNPFLDTIAQQITKALDADGLDIYRTVLSEELSKVLEQLKLPEIDCESKQIAQGLITALQQSGEECLVINQAFTGAMFRCFDPDEEGSVYNQTQAEHKRLANSIERILGYLVLSLVDPNDAKQLSDWLGHDELSGMYFELHVRTMGGVELFISHHQQRSPEIDLNDSGGDVIGKHLIFVKTAPFQWQGKAKLRDVQLHVWNAVHADTRTHHLSSDEVSRLRADLKTKSVQRRDPQHYCLVFESEEDMNQSYAEQCAEFLKDLNIPMIRYKVGGQQKAFHGLENTLMSAVTAFLQQFSEYRDQ